MLHTFKIIMKNGVTIEVHARHCTTTRHLGVLSELEIKGSTNVHILHIDLNQVVAVTQVLNEEPAVKSDNYPQDIP